MIKEETLREDATKNPLNSKYNPFRSIISDLIKDILIIRGRKCAK